MTSTKPTAQQDPTMDIAVNRTELESLVNWVLQAARGDATERDVSGPGPLCELSDALRRLFDQHRRLAERASEHARHAIATNVALSECLAALHSVQEGDIERRVSDAVTSSTNELLANLARAINAALTASHDQQQVIIKQQHRLILELSTPILEVWDGVLVLPIVGDFGRARSSEVAERLLLELSIRRCRVCILDMTGVGTIDAETAESLARLIRAIRLLGSECLLTGIRPSVARSMIEIGVDLTNIRTEANLQAGLVEAIRGLAG